MLTRLSVRACQWTPNWPCGTKVSPRTTECASLSSLQRGALPSSFLVCRSLASNYLCLPGNTTAVACQNIRFGPGQPDVNLPSGSTLRTPCNLLPWNCGGSQPAPNAPCISPGVWFVIGSLSTSNATSPVIISGNTTVQGNLTVPVGTTITVRVGAIVTVEGCVTINGNLVVDASGRTITNGTQIDLINFNSSCSNGTSAVDFGTVTVSGASTERCKTATASDVLSTRGLSVVFLVVDVPNCDGTPGASGPSDSVVGPNLTAIIAGSVAGGVVFVVLVGLIILYFCRRKIVPAYRMESRMRKIRTTSADH